MPSLPILCRTTTHYVLALIALACLPALGAWWYSQQHFEKLNLGDYLSYRCETGNYRDDSVFQVLTLTSAQAADLANQLCKNPLMKQRYGAVTITWHPRAFLTAKHIIEGKFHLLWNRHHVVHGLVPDAAAFYQAIVDTPRYALYWISRESPPELSEHYLKNRTIGFSNDQQSQTFYLRPMAALQAAGLHLRPEQQRFYPGVGALMEAFASGEVDIISGLRPSTVENDEQLHYTLLDENVPSGSWYLRRDLYRPDFACELATSLIKFDDMLDGPSTILLPGGCQ